LKEDGEGKRKRKKKKKKEILLSFFEPFPQRSSIRTSSNHGI